MLWRIIILKALWSGLSTKISNSLCPFFSFNFLPKSAMGWSIRFSSLIKASISMSVRRIPCYNYTLIFEMSFEFVRNLSVGQCQHRQSFRIKHKTCINASLLRIYTDKDCIDATPTHYPQQIYNKFTKASHSTKISPHHFWQGLI